MTLRELGGPKKRCGWTMPGRGKDCGKRNTLCAPVLAEYTRPVWGVMLAPEKK